MHVGAEHLIHYFHVLKPLRIPSRRVRINSYTSGEVPSLKKHRDPSSALIILILFLQNNPKWSRQVFTKY